MLCSGRQILGNLRGAEGELGMFHGAPEIHIVMSYSRSAKQQKQTERQIPQDMIDFFFFRLSREVFTTWSVLRMLFGSLLFQEMGAFGMVQSQWTIASEEEPLAFRRGWETCLLGHRSKGMQEALQLLDAGANHEVAVTLHAGAWVMAIRGDYKQAIEQFQKSLKMQRRYFGDINHPDIADTLYALAYVNGKLEDEKAEQYLEESLKMFQSLNSGREHPAIVKVLRLRSDLAEKTGDHQKALLDLQDALQMQMRLSSGEAACPNLRKTRLQLAWLQAQTKDFGKSLQCLVDILVETLRAGDQLGVAEILRELGLVTDLSGNRKKACAYLQMALQIQKKVHGDQPDWAIVVTLLELGSVATDDNDLE